MLINNQEILLKYLHNSLEVYFLFNSRIGLFSAKIYLARHTFYNCLIFKRIRLYWLFILELQVAKNFRNSKVINI